MRIFSILCFAAVMFTSSPASVSAADDAPAADGDAKAKPVNVDPVVEKTKNIAAENALHAAEMRKALRKQTEEKSRLQLEQKLVKLRLTNSLAKLAAEKARLDMDNAIAAARNQKAVAALTVENQKATLEMAHRHMKLMTELATLTDTKQRLALTNQVNDEKTKAALAAIKRERDELAAANDLESERLRKVELKNRSVQLAVESEMNTLKLESARIQFEQIKQQAALAKIQSDIAMRAQAQSWESEVNKEKSWPEKPYVDDILTISDRRIALNGPIISGTADYITTRIHYFNNQSIKAPIFIVIDRCPGGSVMEGYRIVKAIEASKAPIYVVVKSFAASMAAVIVTTAKESYAYPNSIILHHQPWSVSWGNLTQQKEQVELMKEWSRRVHEPVAKKMGIKLKTFYDRMYKNNSDGDWLEFADKAAKLKWVDHVVTEIREEGVRKEPADAQSHIQWIFATEKTDDKGQQYIRLPRAGPTDFYFLYNPKRYYRWD